MTTLITDHYSAFAHPVPLPCFVDEKRRMDVWCDGYRLEQMVYDGFQNLLEITPLVKASPELIGGCYLPVGQSYTISNRGLHRAIADGAVARGTCR